MPSWSPDTDLTIDRRAPVRRLDLDGGSWVDVVDGFVTDADEQFRRLHDDTPWQQTEVLRYERYVPEKRLSAGLRDDADPLLRQTTPAPRVAVPRRLDRRRRTAVPRR